MFTLTKRVNMIGQIPASNSVDMMNALLAVVSLLGICLLIKNLFFPKAFTKDYTSKDEVESIRRVIEKIQDEIKQFIPKEDFNMLRKSVDDCKNQINEVRTELRDEINTAAERIADRVNNSIELVTERIDKLILDVSKMLNNTGK